MSGVIQVVDSDGNTFCARRIMQGGIQIFPPDATNLITLAGETADLGEQMILIMDTGLVTTSTQGPLPTTTTETPTTTTQAPVTTTTQAETTTVPVTTTTQAVTTTEAETTKQAATTTTSGPTTTTTLGPAQPLPGTCCWDYVSIPPGAPGVCPDDCDLTYSEPCSAAPPGAPPGCIGSGGQCYYVFAGCDQNNLCVEIYDSDDCGV